MDKFDLLKERQKRGLSQNLLAAMSGVAQATVSLVERGLVTPSAQIREKLRAGIAAYDERERAQLSSKAQ